MKTTATRMAMIKMTKSTTTLTKTTTTMMKSTKSYDDGDYDDEDDVYDNEDDDAVHRPSRVLTSDLAPSIARL